MMKKTTFMRYGHDPNCRTGRRFNKKTHARWAKSHQISSIIEKNLLDIKKLSTSRDVSHHKEEGEKLLKRRKIEKKYETFCQPENTLLILKIT